MAVVQGRVGRSLRRIPPLLFTLWLLSGCATGGGRLRDQVSASLPLRAQIADVPFFPQEADQCGPATLAMVLKWSGLDLSPEQVRDQVYLPDRQGSLQSSLITAARRHGRLAYPIDQPSCLLQEIAAGHPVIVLQNLGVSWYQRWHYAVVHGYDLEKAAVVMHSGLEADRRVGWKTFEHTWRRSDYWGVVVLPADQLPACVSEEGYLNAALGLQRAGAGKEAVRAFATAANHWPDSAKALMGLGNAHYAAGNLEGAVPAFRQATRIAPHNGAAFNNLAHVLAQLGRWDEAETMAAQAVQLGGPQLPLFRRTLEEIREQRPASENKTEMGSE